MQRAPNYLLHQVKFNRLLHVTMYVRICIIIVLDAYIQDHLLLFLIRKLNGHYDPWYQLFYLFGFNKNCTMHLCLYVFPEVISETSWEAFCIACVRKSVVEIKTLHHF